MNHLQNHLFSIAGLGIFLLLAIATLPDNRNNNSNSNSNASRSTDTIKYVNSRTSLTGKLAENYVDFSFEYPKTWVKVPGSSNFVKVEHETADKDTIENFAVGYLTAPRSMLPALAHRFMDQISGGFPNYEKTSEGETTVGPYTGYEVRFSSHQTARGAEVYFWGRIILLPSEGSRKGAALVLLASSKSPDVHGPEDVGEKGELPIVLNSFRFTD